MEAFKLGPACRLSCCQAFLQAAQAGIPNLDAYVKLARQPLQAAVTMAMQVGPPFAHIPPGPEGIVAQDEVHAIDTHLGIRLDALPVARLPKPRADGRRSAIAVMSCRQEAEGGSICDRCMFLVGLWCKVASSRQNPTIEY